MYLKDDHANIPINDDPRIIKSGMAKGTRFIGNSLDTATPIIQIDPKKALFYSRMPLVDFVEQISK